MAKYKKSKKKQAQTPEEIINVSKAEKFVEGNITNLLIGFATVIAVAFVIIYLSNSGRGKETKAETEAIVAQNAFQNGDWQTTLNGDGTSPGFVEIASNYPKTKIGNLAHYYLGITYMKQSNFDLAAEELNKFKATKDPNINGLAYMNLGDALSELGKNDEALANYKKAAASKSELFLPDFLLRYGLAQMNASDYAGAKQSFTELTNNYPNTVQGNTAEQYLAGL